MADFIAVDEIQGFVEQKSGEIKNAINGLETFIPNKLIPVINECKPSAYGGSITTIYNSSIVTNVAAVTCVAKFIAPVDGYYILTMNVTSTNTTGQTMKMYKYADISTYHIGYIYEESAVTSVISNSYSSNSQIILEQAVSASTTYDLRTAIFCLAGEPVVISTSLGTGSGGKVNSILIVYRKRV